MSNTEQNSQPTPEQLLPCAWCGSDEIKMFRTREPDEGEVWYAQCMNCTSCGPDHKNGRHWNNRQGATKELLAEVAKALSEAMEWSASVFEPCAQCRGVDGCHVGCDANKAFEDCAKVLGKAMQVIV